MEPLRERPAHPLQQRGGRHQRMLAQPDSGAPGAVGTTQQRRQAFGMALVPGMAARGRLHHFATRVLSENELDRKSVV